MSRGAAWLAGFALAACGGAPVEEVYTDLAHAPATEPAALVANLVAMARETQASDPERAWRSVGSAVELDASHAEARVLQALLAWARAERDDARAAWAAVPEADPLHPWVRAHRAMAGALAALDGVDAAADLAWLAAHADRDSDAARCGAALAALGRDDLDAAASALAGCAERWEAWALSGILAEREPEPDHAAAAAAYDRVLAAAPALGFVCAGRARCADAASPGTGASFWDRAIRSENWRADHRRDRGLSRLAAGDAEAAQADLAWAQRLAPGDAAITRALARVALARGEPVAALSAIDDALRRFPRDGPLWSEKARLLVAMERWEDSLAALDQVLMLDPESTASLATRARVRGQLGDAAGARADLDAALARDPRNAEGLLTRAQMRAEAGDARGALADCDAALDSDGELTDAYRLRARLRLDRRDPAGAEADLDAFLARGGADPWAFLARGRLRTADGRFAEAAADLDRAVALAPKDHAAWLAKGELAEARGQLKDALEAFDRVVRARPTFRLALARRGLLHAGLAEWRSARRDLEAALADDDGEGLQDPDLAARCRMTLADMRAKRR